MPLILTAVLQPALAARSDAQIVLDGTLGGLSGPLSGPHRIITPEHGQIRAGNLFHSFSQFSVPTAESATFTGPTTVQNILARVTGSQSSVIDGLLRSDIQGANLFLLNPRGVVFGPNATLDVTGSFYVSTADHVRFADGARFHADPSQPSGLSAASPAAFGFLGPDPASIEVRGQLQGATGRTLAIVGGDVQITGGAVRAPSGRIDIVSVASPGSVGIAAPVPALEGFGALGPVGITQGVVTTAGAPGGTIAIRGGRLVVQGAALSSATTGIADHPGIGIHIEIAGPMMLRLSEIASSSFGEGRAGDVRVVAGSLELYGDPVTFANANIGSRAFGAGDGGDVVIRAERLVLGDVSFINAPSLAGGRGGNVTVDVGSLELSGPRGFAFIATGAFGTGDAGNLEVVAREVLIRGGIGGFVGLATQVSDAASGAANAGVLRLVADSVTLLDGAQLSSGVFRGSGRGGDLDVTAGTLTIAGTNPFGFRSGIFASLEGPAATGRGGDIRVTAGELRLSDRGAISTSLLFGSPGDAGNVTVNAGLLDVRSAAFIASSAVFGAGNAGNVDITASRVDIIGVPTSLDPSVTDFTGISTSTQSGRGGTLRLTADRVHITGLGALASVSIGAGAGGDIFIDASAGGLDVTGGASITSSAFGSGRGGDIDIRAGDVTVAGCGRFNGLMDSGASAIGSQAGLGGGAAGSVSIVADSLQVLDGARVTTETFGAGDGGAISVTAGRVLVSGVSTALEDALRTVPGADPSLAGATITASSNGAFLGSAATGNAGTIHITAGDLQVTAGGSVASRTDTPGAGGSIQVLPDRLTVASGGQLISSSDAGAAGRGGDIAVTASEWIAISGRRGDRQSGLFSTAAGSGDAGRIAVTTPALTMSDAGMVSVATSSTGQAGSVEMSLDTLTMTGGSRVESSTTGAGTGGSVTVRAASSVSIGGSAGAPTGLFSTASGSGDAGRLFVATPVLTLSESGAISAATEGAGNAGSIVVGVTTGTLVSGAQVDSGTTTSGRGGSIHVTATGALSIAGAGSGIFSVAEGDGDAGTIDVSASMLLLADGGAMSVATAGAGRAGSASVEADEVIVRGGRIESGTTAGGAGGSITVTATSVAIEGGAFTSNATASGPGGNIEVSAGQIHLARGAEISARSSGTGNAGNIALHADDVLTASASAVTTQATVADGGNIELTAPRMVWLTETRITTSVESGFGAGGNILVDPRFLLLNGSAVRADAFGGPGGNVRMVADVFLVAHSIISASSSLGIPGTIDIQAGITDVAGTLVALPESVLQAASLLRASCAIRLADGPASSLVLAGRVLPPDPSGLLPSPLLLEGPAETRLSWSQGGVDLMVPPTVLPWPASAGCVPLGPRPR